MSIQIMTANAAVDIDPKQRFRKRAEPCTVDLEIWKDWCRVWDYVNFTDCGTSYTYAAEANDIGQPIASMPFFSEVFRHLAEQYAAHRNDPLGVFLSDIISAMETALGMAVYFAEADGRIKIGYSRNVATRIAQLQTGNPTAIKLLGITPGGRAKEREIHDQFADARLAGEWFNATPALLAYIRDVTA